MTAQQVLPTNGVKKTGYGKEYAVKPLIDTIVNGFFTVDKKWTVQYWNAAAEKILNVRSEEIVGKNILEIFADIIPIEFYAIYHKAFEHNLPIHFEEYWGEMGAWFDVITYYCDDTLSVSFKSSNKSTDPHQPSSLEQQLQIKTGLYKFITEVTNDCLWEWDLMSKEIFWIDGGHKRMFGYPVENALIPQSFWEAQIHPEDKNRILEKIDHILRDNSTGSWEEEYRFRKANGTYAWVHDRGLIIYEKNEKCRMIGASQDITERVVLREKLMVERLENERMIEKLLIKTQEKERAAFGQHLLQQVGNILCVSKLYVEMAKKAVDNRDSLLDDSCNYIVFAIEKIRKISNDLSPNFIKELGLLQCIRILIADMATGDDLRVSIHDSGLSLDNVDQQLQLDMYRVVEHQLVNILQYANASLVSIGITRFDKSVILFISDNGRGCDLTADTNGSGIKNMIVRANLYHGELRCVSRPGEGFILQVIFKAEMM